MADVARASAQALAWSWLWARLWCGHGEATAGGEAPAWQAHLHPIPHCVPRCAPPLPKTRTRTRTPMHMPTRMLSHAMLPYPSRYNSGNASSSGTRASPAAIGPSSSSAAGPRTLAGALGDGPPSVLPMRPSATSSDAAAPPSASHFQLDSIMSSTLASQHGMTETSVSHAVTCAVVCCAAVVVHCRQPVPGQPRPAASSLSFGTGVCGGGGVGDHRALVLRPLMVQLIPGAPRQSPPTITHPHLSWAAHQHTVRSSSLHPVAP